MIRMSILSAVLAAMTALFLSAKVGSADINTSLQYNQQYNQVVGLSQTNLYYSEFEDEYWCIQWAEYCTQILLYHQTAATAGALYGPSGLSQSDLNASGQLSSGVGYAVGNPQLGQWVASADHYTVIDIYTCSVYPDYQWGGYVLGQCYYSWSETGSFLGATSAQTTVAPGIVNVEYTMSIPFDHIRLPLYLGASVYDGDSHASWYPGSTYRIRQSFQVNTATSTVSNIQNLSGCTYRYADGSSAHLSSTQSCFRKYGPAPTYSVTLESIVHLGKCRIVGTHNCKKQANDMGSMQVAVTSSTPTSVEVLFKGHPGNDCPLFAYDISWDNRIVIQWQSGRTFTLNLDHDGFPNHQIRVNGQVVYEHDVFLTGHTPLSLGFPTDIQATVGPNSL